MLEIGLPCSIPSTLLIDNQSAISVAKNLEHHGRMKHLDLSFYWLRDVVHSGLITPRFVPTSDQAADLLTKALSRAKVEDFCKICSMVQLSDHCKSLRYRSVIWCLYTVGYVS